MLLLTLATACGASAGAPTYSADEAQPPPGDEPSAEGRIASVFDGSRDWAGGFTFKKSHHVAFPPDAILALRTDDGFEQLAPEDLEVGDRVRVWAYETLLRSPPVHHATYVLVEGDGS